MDVDVLKVQGKIFFWSRAFISGGEKIGGDLKIRKGRRFMSE
jgi:hypothetical protein